MSIWTHLAHAAAALLAFGGPIGLLARDVFGRQLPDTVRAMAQQRRQVAFSVAAIALAAKMAQADGHASDDEFATFQRLFHVEERERGNVERFYRYAKQSTDGFEAYARQARQLLGDGAGVLEDLLEALLLIAVTDGVHVDEIDFLDRVAEELGIDAAAYARIRAHYMPTDADDPYVTLGLAPGASRDDVRQAYRQLVKQHHPDRHMAEGTPAAFIRVAEDRMAAINAAYGAIMRGTWQASWQAAAGGTI